MFPVLWKVCQRLENLGFEYSKLDHANNGFVLSFSAVLSTTRDAFSNKGVIDVSGLIFPLNTKKYMMQVLASNVEPSISKPIAESHRQIIFQIARRDPQTEHFSIYFRNPCFLWAMRFRDVSTVCLELRFLWRISFHETKNNIVTSADLYLLVPEQSCKIMRAWPCSRLFA